MPEDSKNFENKLYRLLLPFTKHFHSDAFENTLHQANIDLDVDFYFSKNFFIAIFIFFAVLLFGFILSFLFPSELSFSAVIILSIISFIIFIGYTFINPYILISSKNSSIKNELPLAIIGMSSVAESGAPPISIFSTKSAVNKTQHLEKEFQKIVFYVSNMGISLLEAIDIVAKKTPSNDLKKFLLSLKSNLEAGGSLSDFMKKKADQAKFQYTLQLNTQNQKAETFGDIYSAIVVAGPLFLFSGIMLLGMVGGGIAGLSITSIMQLGVFILVPVINIAFIIILNLIS